MMSWDYCLYLSGGEFTPAVSVYKKDIKTLKLLNRQKGELRAGSQSKIHVTQEFIAGNSNLFYPRVWGLYSTCSSVRLTIILSM